MKTPDIRVFSLASVLTSLLLFACACSTSKPSQNRPVQNVHQSREAVAREMISIFTQDRALFTNTFRMQNRAEGKQYADAIQRYTAGLRSIDYSGSPQTL